jgi:pimeloyl-ACP methyl ester carboxylesterase
MVTINGTELYVEVHGADADVPVLLLHGAIGNSEELDGLAAALVDAGYRTVAFDARGRGRSPWGDAPITYDRMTADAVGVLDHLGIGRAHVVGWSQGGEIALSLAIHHPDRLLRVVAYGATYAPEGNRTQILVTDQLPPFEKFVDDYRRLSPEPERFDELLRLTITADFTEAELQGITVPVLVLDGEAEEFVEPEHTARMAELIPGSTLIVMPGTGHFAPIAQPDEFNRIVLEYLAG